MTTMKDMDLLNGAHDEAIRTMGDAAIAIAETVLEGGRPTEEMLRAYAFARLGVQSTRRDLEYVLSIELEELFGNMEI